MIDFHSHVLPQMDDGSRDVAESVAMLEMLAQQGVRRVVATPHFYADSEPMERFLERRAACCEKLTREMPAGLPPISLGAEVRYYQGISRNEELSRLCIEGTELLLLEMPTSRWTEYTAREIADLASRGDFMVALAHVDRYRDLQQPRVWDIIARSGVVMQVNADCFTGFLSRRRWLRRLAEGEVHLIGSDCHGITHRPPNIGSAFHCIRSRWGDDFTENLLRFQHNLFPIEEAETSSKI